MLGFSAKLVVLWACATSAPPLPCDGPTAELRGEIIDDATGQALAARVYIRSADGRWFFARSASEKGSAVEYRKERRPESVEMHTTLSAHPFTAKLPPGRYTVTVERGKEYLPVEREVVIEHDPVRIRIQLRRWIHMAQHGWYSGDTHVHRALDELPNLLLAEDLNVALPLSYWVTTAHTAPTSGDKSTAADLRPKPIEVDPTHVFYPVNTEYEIFTVDGKPHTLGAVFILGHRTPLELGVPPVRAIAEQARREGAILDLDKHSWPWSLMLVPVMQVDLFELANNHVWRTEFAFRQWTLDTVPEYMQLERDMDGLTEWGWIEFGFKTYYALLNCGFRMRPSAGTASGVHPLPLGFGRVYVHLPGGFEYAKWMEGLRQGRSFVSTGPMLMIEVDGEEPGHVFADAIAGAAYRVTGSAESAVPLDRIEMIVNGRVARVLNPLNEKTVAGGYRSVLDESVWLDGSGWIAVRAFERRPDHRIRFAHTAPVHIDVSGEPLRARREEIGYLMGRVQEELDRNKGVLGPVELEEYREALRRYEDVAKTAR